MGARKTHRPAVIYEFMVEISFVKFFSPSMQALERQVVV